MDALAQAKKFFRDGNFVVLDTETTGLDISVAEIVEIAIINHAGEPLLDTLIRPTLPIPAEVMRIHGITDGMVQEAPPFSEIFPRIAELLKDKIAVVYNADYDMTILEDLAEHHGFGFWESKSWCLMQNYANFKKTPGRYGDYKWHKLSDACAQQRVMIGTAHRALGDAQAAYALLKALSEKE